MSDLVKITGEIQKKIRDMESKRLNLERLIETRKKAMYAYFKKKAVTVINLKNKEVVFLEGKQIRKNYPDSMIIPLSELVAMDEKVALEISELEYNAAVASLRSLQAELNGYQTILKYQEESEKWDQPKEFEEPQFEDFQSIY